MSIITSDDSLTATRRIRALIKHCTILSLLAYLIGLGILAYLIHEPLKSSFSDNSLLPGLANREFTESKLTGHHLMTLENLTSSIPENSIPFGYLRAEFEKAGLRVYEHDFEFHYPFVSKPEAPYRGRNLYAVLRAPRGARTEAIVLSTPYRSKMNPHGSTLASVALMLGLAKYFSTRNYWAKDLIFLIGDRELVGMQAWLQAYHNLDHSRYLKPGVLNETSGLLQAAINLEIQSFEARAVELKIEGLNGQLPNLDLFNLAVEWCHRESMPVTFHGDSFYTTPSEWDDWLRKARTLGSMMITQATTLPTGAHGLFQKFAIQSITLETVPKPSQSYGQVSQLYLGRAIEGIVRSINNMLERFNRSIYFYLIPSTRRFISIAFYMSAFGAMALPLAFRALHHYFEMLDAMDQGEKSGGFSLWSAFEANFTSHLIGIITLSTVPLFLARLTSLSPYLSLTSPSQLIFSTLLTISLLSLTRLNKTTTRANFHLQIMLSLLNTLLVLTCLAVINISLALFLTLLLVPLLTLVVIQEQQNQRWVKRIPKTILLVLTHPLVLHFLTLLALSLWYEDFSKGGLNWFELFLKHTNRAARSQPKTILYYIEDWYLYDNWSFPLVSLAVLPVWLQLWYGAWTVVN